MKFILFFSAFFLTNLLFGQTYIPFEGEFIYSVEVINPETKKANLVGYTSVFTNDTLVRIDSESPSLGKQTLLKNLLVSKQYVLLTYNGKKYAIQQHLTKDTSKTKYTFKSCFGSKKFGGIRAKKILVSHPNFKTPMVFYFAKNLNPGYLGIIKGIAGLPVQYYIQTEDGLLCYTLREYKQKEIPAGFFQVSKEFEKISFNDFMDRIVSKSSTN
jgi:hypothetical protein